MSKLKSALRAAINDNVPNRRVVKVWGIDKSSSLHDDELGEETWLIEVKVRKVKPRKLSNEKIR